MAAVTVLLGLPSLGWPASSGDEIILLVLPLRMMAGDLPYEDFGSAYGPTHWWFLEGVYRIAGATVQTERLLGLTIHVLITVGLYFLTRHRGPLLAVMSGFTGAVLMYPLGTAPYAWVSCVALVLWSAIALTARETRLNAALAGVLGALSIGFRPDTALLVLVPACVVLRGQRRWWSWFAGIAAGSLPLVVSVVLTPGGLLGDVVLGRATRGAGQSRLPLPVDTSQRLVMLVYLLGVLLALTAAIVSRTRWQAVVAALAVFSLPQAFQRTDVIHFLYGALLSVTFLPQALRSLVAVLRRPQLVAATMSGALITATIAPTVLGPMGQAQRWRASQTETIRHDGREFPEAPDRVAAVRQLLSTLDELTTPTTRLFVFDRDLANPMFTDLVVYYLMPNTRQLARNLEINPGLTNTRKARVAEDLENADVAVLVTVPPERRRAVLPHQQPGPAEPVRALERLFCHVTTVDYYEVFRRCR